MDLISTTAAAAAAATTTRDVNISSGSLNVTNEST